MFAAAMFGPTSLDLVVGQAVQASQPAWLNGLMSAVSGATIPELVAGALLAVAGLLLIFRRKRQATIIAVLSIGNVWSLLVKYAVNRPRPTADQLNLLAWETSPSFPSGHAVGIVLLAVVVMTLVRPKTAAGRRWLTVGLIMVILLVGWSRLYLGIHWLTDVLGGYLIAGIWIALCYRLFGSVLRRDAPTSTGPPR